jgi:predicted AAA+ superfamily ATPase
MAISNRARVGQGFEYLAEGLGEYIDGLMGEIAPGVKWDDAVSQILGRAMDAQDVQTHLVLLTEKFAQLFKDRLPYAARTYANELRDFRNDWAHMKSFSADDTTRMLDTAERLLELVDQPDLAAKVRGSKLDHQRVVFEAEMKKLAQKRVDVPGVGVKPWREVLAPHPDVASGDFSSAEFAADLHMVAQGEGSAEYVDPVEFFRRTYLTAGLRELLGWATSRLSGDGNAPPVVNLQTNFGGGKTHSMLALYHAASGTPLEQLPQEVQALLGGRGLPASVQRAVLVGTHLKPGSTSTKPDGTVVHTLWGELAWQLGGAEGYGLVADADQTRTSPGDALVTLLRNHGPALVLIDEWVAYARQLYGRDDLPAGTFDVQFTFAQALTEAAKAVPGSMVVISIPASDQGSDAGASSIEVGGTYGLEALQRLQNVVRRVAQPWRPATADEAFEIVRRRLFEEPDATAQAEISGVARRFIEFYNQHRGEFPRECAEPDYERRIKSSYPIHPELFDRLYEDWSTLERFQRTRGVLRLMSTVVHALWQSGDAAPLIMPGTVPLHVATVASEITQYLHDQWKPIIDADVDGDSSVPVRIDTDKPLLGARSMTRRFARTVFMGSAPTVGTAHKGIERPRAYLGMAVPGDTVGNFGLAKDALAQRATYFYVDGTRYWYDTQVSVARTAQDYADRLRDHPEEVWAELGRRLLATEGRVKGDFAAVHVCPDSSGDVPDLDAARLVILSPQHVHRKDAGTSAALTAAQTLLDTRGAGQRIHRNTLVFLAPDTKRADELADAVRDYLAWSHITSRVEELNLNAQQAAQARTRQKQADDTVTLRIGETYIWTLVPAQPDPTRPADWDEIKTEGTQDRLASRVSAKLKTQGMLATTYGSRNVRLDLNGPLAKAWENGHVAVGDLWGYYTRYPYLTRLRDRSVLDGAVGDVVNQITWEAEGFALADGYDEATDGYVGLVIPHENAPGPITDTTLLVDPERALAQPRLCPSCGRPAHDGPCEPAADGPSGRGSTAVPAGPGEVGGRSTEGPGDGPAIAANTRYFGVYRLDPERYGRDLTRLSQEILQPLASVDGATMEIVVEIHASKAEGFPADKVRVVQENASTLRFEQSAFEDE